MLQTSWGCPAAGLTPPAALDPDFARAAQGFARVTGGETDTTCPFACLERADQLVVEITRAAMFMGEHFDVAAFRTATGREPTHVDAEAWAAWKRAGMAAWRSDRERDRQERERTQNRT